MKCGLRVIQDSCHPNDRRNVGSVSEEFELPAEPANQEATADAALSTKLFSEKCSLAAIEANENRDQD